MVANLLGGKACIEYDDGDKGAHDLAKEVWRLEKWAVRVWRSFGCEGEREKEGGRKKVESDGMKVECCFQNHASLFLSQVSSLRLE